MINIPDSSRTKLNSWKTGENIRHTEYGDYYILDEIKSEADLVSKKGFNPYSIDLYFEAKDQGLCIFHIVIPPVNVICKIHTIILFPCDTTLRILDKRNLAEILSGDKGLFDNFLDAALSLGIDFEKSLVLGRDSNALYEFKASLERYTQDLETKVKLEMDYPITVKDIEETEGLELRERVLRKFGYENFIKNEFKNGKVVHLIYDDEEEKKDKGLAYLHRSYYTNPLVNNAPNDNDDKIIFLRGGITFLQVKDPSSGKIYFLKVPPDMRSVQEAKAWTFGLEKEEYNPEIET